MTSADIVPENAKERQSKVCPYLGLLQDSQTTLAFPSGANLCYHAKPLASPNLEYQRAFCLKGRQHTQCPVFTRTELAPLPPEISGNPSTWLFFGRPVEKRFILPIIIACVVLILAVIGATWLFNGHGGNNAAMSGRLESPTPTSNEIPLETTPLSDTIIPITPNVTGSSQSNTDTPVAITTETETPQASQTATPFGYTPLPTHTQVPCGSPYTWVVYIVRSGDTLFRLSQLYGVTVAELQRANCMGTFTTLHTGMILYVPPISPIFPSPTLPGVIVPTSTSINTSVPVLPTDTATEPPVDTATQIPTPTDIPTDTLVSP